MENKCNKIRQSIEDKNKIIDNNEYVKALFDNMISLEHQSNKRYKEGYFDNMEFADTTRIESLINRLEELDDAGHLDENDLLKLDKYLFYKYQAKLHKRKDLNNNK